MCFYMTSFPGPAFIFLSKLATAAKFSLIILGASMPVRGVLHSFSFARIFGSQGTNWRRKLVSFPGGKKMQKDLYFSTCEAYKFVYLVNISWGLRCSLRFWSGLNYLQSNASFLLKVIFFNRQESSPPRLERVFSHERPWLNLQLPLWRLVFYCSDSSPESLGCYGLWKGNC